VGRHYVLHPEKPRCGTEGRGFDSRHLHSLRGDLRLQARLARRVASFFFGVKSSLRVIRAPNGGGASFAPPRARSGCHASVAPTNHATLRAVTPRLPLLPRCTPNDARNA